MITSSTLRALVDQAPPPPPTDGFTAKEYIAAMEAAGKPVKNLKVVREDLKKAEHLEYGTFLVKGHLTLLFWGKNDE